MTSTYNPKKWSELAYKDKAAYATAILSFMLGWIILFIGLFIPPMGEIDPSVLTAFGTALVYAGSIFGVAIFLKSSKAEILERTQQLIEEYYCKKEESNE